ncbi:tRNA adenosine(34) deaminase TadA [Suttonella ornithocola]|uniref:tRNA-specific adenosine deaminase n=1 Tax=Suttonella ornithocola TaxID=279832 RepID=A0A380MU02_9GAMM|nr:tRNA adenosine(34) deaminase TadA [Suttonella ornithocola]SUO95403.1 tRNA-specific adenosine deaminase [Suttonella ornithocola]
MTDEDWMRLALEEAKLAADNDEVPIGAVLIRGEQLLAKAGNRTIRDCDPSAHAEVLVLREGAKCLGNYRLGNCALYVTVEPCVMCVGALVQARVRKLVYGAYNLRGGACGTSFDLARHPILNHQITELKSGILAQECGALMQDFFEKKRKR